MVPMSVLGLNWCPHAGWTVVLGDPNSQRRLRFGVPLADALVLGQELVGRRTERSGLYELVRAMVCQQVQPAHVQLSLAAAGVGEASLVLSPSDPRIAYPAPIVD